MLMRYEFWFFDNESLGVAPELVGVGTSFAGAWEGVCKRFPNDREVGGLRASDYTTPGARYGELPGGTLVCILREVHG